MDVIIMRGVPGAGKSSFIKKYFPGAVVLSADNGHIDPDGVYRYRQDRAAEVHRLLYADFLRRLIAGGTDTLVVDNTNTTVWELAPYYRAAEALGHRVKIIEIKCDPEVCAHRTTHGVPAVRIGMMHQALMTERVPNWWRREVYDQDSKLVYMTPD